MLMAGKSGIRCVAHTGCVYLHAEFRVNRGSLDVLSVFLLLDTRSFTSGRQNIHFSSEALLSVRLSDVTASNYVLPIISAGSGGCPPP